MKINVCWPWLEILLKILPNRTKNHVKIVSSKILNIFGKEIVRVNLKADKMFKVW